MWHGAFLTLWCPRSKAGGAGSFPRGAAFGGWGAGEWGGSNRERERGAGGAESAWLSGGAAVRSNGAPVLPRSGVAPRATFPLGAWSALVPPGPLPLAAGVMPSSPPRAPLGLLGASLREGEKAPVAPSPCGEKGEEEERRASAGSGGSSRTDSGGAEGPDTAGADSRGSRAATPRAPGGGGVLLRMDALDVARRRVDKGEGGARLKRGRGWGGEETLGVGGEAGAEAGALLEATGADADGPGGPLGGDTATFSATPPTSWLRRIFSRTA